MFGGRGGGGPGPGQQFETEDFGEATGAGQDLHASLTITLADAAKGTKTRVHLPTGKDVEVKIPAGIGSGQQIRLKGQGWPSATGRAGDALITINVAPHPLFKPDGADLRLELPISLYEAVLGGKVRVPTLDGAVELAIPAGTNSGRTFRLKGKGLKAKSGAGDLLATVRVVLPERVDDEFKELMKTWRDKKPTIRGGIWSNAWPRDAGISGPAGHGCMASRRKLQLFRCAFVDLFVDRLGHVFEPLAIGRATHYIGDFVVDPVERGELLIAGVTQRRLWLARLRAIDREALAGRTFVHVKGGGAGRTWKKSAADQFQPDRLQVGDTQVLAQPLR
jgi:hypothetical protein